MCSWYSLGENHWHKLELVTKKWLILKGKLAYAVNTGENNMLSNNGKIAIHCGHWDPANREAAFHMFNLFVCFWGKRPNLIFLHIYPGAWKMQIYSHSAWQCKIKKIFFLFSRYVYVPSLWLNFLICKMGVIKLCLLWGLK